MVKKHILWLLAALVLFASCATPNFLYKESTAKKVVNLVNGRDAERLAALSHNPFLLDGEIILMPGDMELFWDRAFASGFALKGGSVESVVPVDSDTPRFFGDTMDVRVFFRKHVPSTASLATIRTDTGVYRFVFNDRDGMYPGILAFGGQN